MNYKETDNEMNNLVFTEDTDKDPAKLELYQTNGNTLCITLEPAEDDDYMRFMRIELDIDDAKALANELTRIVRLMDASAMHAHATALQSQKEASDGDAIPAWRLKEKQQQLKLITA